MRSLLHGLLPLVALGLVGCIGDDNTGVPDAGDSGTTDGGGGDSTTTVTLDKTSVKLGIFRSATLTASEPVTWSVQEAGGGTVDANGKYISPATPGVYHVVATSKANPGSTATAAMTVVDLQVQLVAGVIGGAGNTDGPANRAHFNNPQGAAHAVDGSSFRVYVADTDNHTIRVYDDSTKKVSTLAGLAGTSGTANGTGNAARFNSPSGVAIDPAFNQGTFLYVADTANHCIRSVDTSNGTVTTLSGVCGSSGTADGSATTARFMAPSSIALNAFSTATALDVCDNQSIRRVNLTDGSVQTLSGLTAVYNCQLVRDRYYWKTFFTDDGSAGQLKTFIEGTTTPYTPTIASLGQMPNYEPRALGSDDGWGNGRYTYMVFDNGGGDAVWRYDAIGNAFGAQPVLGDMNSYGYVDGKGVDARFQDIAAIDSAPEYSRLYLVDRGLDAIRLVDLNSSTLNVTTPVGAANIVDRINGSATTARFSAVFGVSIDDKGVYYISDAVTDGGGPNFKNETVRKLDPSVGNVTDFAGVPGPPFQSAVDGPVGVGTFSWPFYSVWDGGVLYVVDLQASAIRAVDSTGKISTLAGELGVSGASDGVGVAAHFKFLSGQFGGAGITTDHAGHLYVSDGGNYAIRQIDIATGNVTTIAGGTQGTANGKGKAAQFMAPAGIAFDAGKLYVVDDLDHTVRAMDLTSGDVSTLLGLSGDPGYVDGDASKAQLDSPFDIVADGIGNLYVTELPQATGQQHSGTIRRIDIAGATISTLVGSRAIYGMNPGPRTTASLNCPLAMSITPTGDLAFGDYCDHVVAVVTPL